MKIKKIYVSAFGSLKDFTLELDDGFSVIYGQNEAGKTTLTEFLKAMFYGTGKRAAGQVMGIREKYTPWDGSAAAGRVFFEHNSHNYLLERQFRKSDSTDKVTLTDTDTGKSETCNSDIGNQLFGIGENTFERSVFIGNIPAISKDTEAQGEINQKLSNIALTGDDGVSYQTVNKRLETAKNKLLSKTGRAGSCAEDMARRENLAQELKEADLAAKKKQKILGSINELSLKIDDLNSQYKEVMKILDAQKDIENTQKLKEYLELKGTLDRLTGELTLDNGIIADEMFLRKLEFGFSKLQNMAEKIKSMESELQMLKKAALSGEENSPDVIRERIQKAKQDFKRLSEDETRLLEEINVLKGKVKEAEDETKKAENSKKPFSPVLLVFGLLLILFAAGVYAVFKNVLITALLAAAGAVLCLFGFIIRPRDKFAVTKAKSDLDRLLSELNNDNSRLSLLKGEKNNIEAHIENLNAALNLGINGEQKILDLENRIKAEESSYKEENERVLKFFGLRDGTDITALKDSAEALAQKADEQKQIKLRLNYLSRDLGGISYGEAEEKLRNMKDTDLSADFEKQRETANQLREKLSEAEKLKTALETELKTGFRGISDPEDIRRKLSELDETIFAKKAFCEAAQVAQEVLEESFVTARKSYGAALEGLTLENFKKLTLGAYGNITVSTDLDILAEKNGIFGNYQVEYLSRGTKDQAYLALRLAIAKLICGDNPLPVILDDALSQYDDNRFRAAMRFLKDYSNGSQVMLFTCHNFVCEEAKKQDIPVICI